MTAQANNGGSGNEKAKGKRDDAPPPDEDALIRDIPIDDLDDPDWDLPDSSWPGAGPDPYDAYAGYKETENGSPKFADRHVIDAISRIIELLADTADAVSPEARRQLERILRDLLVAARDTLDWMIERIDEHDSDEVEIEEIPID
ncbi:MAG TPA: hypothetical protein VGO97_03755 [Solirubrobacterales bacterium]|jgi:hypothetical protein|nr:hypothetical protein [Solirubrobacterales bacterium]